MKLFFWTMVILIVIALVIKLYVEIQKKNGAHGKKKDDGSDHSQQNTKNPSQNLLLLGMQKWTTVQDMMRLKREMNRLDEIIGAVETIPKSNQHHERDLNNHPTKM